MINFYTIMTYVTSLIAMAASVVFYIGIPFRIHAISRPGVFEECDKQLRVCRIASLIFVLIRWFVISGCTAEECLEGYQNISVACSWLGFAWLVLAMVNLVTSLILGFLKRNSHEMMIMAQMRRSHFLMAALLLIIAYVLDVK